MSARPPALSLYKKLPYDPVTDFDTIGLVTDVPMILVARPDYPPKDLKELIAYVKERGELFAHSGVGSAAHLCGLMFMSATDAKLTLVPYKGGGPALNDVMGGHIDFYCDPATGPTPLIPGRQAEILRGHHQVAAEDPAGSADHG